MPTAYDEEGAVDQDKRFEGLLARYQDEGPAEMNEFQVWLRARPAPRRV